MTFSPHSYTPGLGGSIKVTYKAAVDGSAVGTITLNRSKLPTNAVITNGVINVKTVPTSGGSATIAVLVGDTTVKTATAVGSYTGAVALNTLPIKTSGTDPQVKVVIAVAALNNAAEFDIVLSYVE